MKHYQWVLFDADETLFSFDAFLGLKAMFLDFGVEFTENHFEDYQSKNLPLWVEYQAGRITARELQAKRFEKWGKILDVDPMTLNAAFLTAMVDKCEPLPGAQNLLEALKSRSRVGVITNGFTELQELRLKRTGLAPYINLLVISEQVGVAKPHVGIFKNAFDKMGEPLPHNTLMVGDNLFTDIKGGFDFGMDTCWVNPQKKPPSGGVVPHYTVGSLVELKELLGV